MDRQSSKASGPNVWTQLADYATMLDAIRTEKQLPPDKMFCNVL